MEGNNNMRQFYGVEIKATVVGVTFLRADSKGEAKRRAKRIIKSAIKEISNENLKVKDIKVLGIEGEFDEYIRRHKTKRKLK